MGINVDWNLSKPGWQHFCHPRYKTGMMKRIFREWHLDGGLLHCNRGCGGLSVGIAGNRASSKPAYLLMISDGNMGDEREFDEVATWPASTPHGEPGRQEGSLGRP